VVVDSAEVARLLERAQTGGHDEALLRAERLLREPTGDLRDGPAGMHFVRCVALVTQGRTDEALAAIDVMLACAECETDPGWRSCGLSLRAYQRLMLGGQHTTDSDLDAVLQDLVDAEAVLEQGVEDLVAAENAHIGIGLGYNQLRLYELALPHYEAAYAVSARDGRGAGNRSMWQSNIATLHLDWALELYRVKQSGEAELHCELAREHALLAAEQAEGPEAELWGESALLLAACAAADGDDPASAAQEIDRRTAALAGCGMHADIGYSRPFLAVALSRSGDQDRALQVVERAVRELPPDAGWLATASAQHTRAILLARHGGHAAEAALTYGETLAQELWRQRIRTLHTAEAMKSYSRLRAEHEQVSLSAHTDSLTGVANRRGFDRTVETMVASETAGRVGVLVVDLDRFKQVNDTHGHDAGDAVLRAVSARVCQQLRDGDLVARLGGDEFVVLLPGADAAAAEAVATRMVEAVDRIEDCTATVSIGVASGTMPDVRATVRQADAAMYAAKRAGGNRALRHRPGHDVGGQSVA
jgi:diguanylate cyclase (GGDEF)-like protein